METDQGQAHLVMLKGPHPDKVFQLAEEEIALGREMQNSIVISDPEISRKHARLRRTESGYAIEDLGSTNGTFVNGARITRPVILTYGDRIGLGETVQLVFYTGAPARDRTVVSGAGSGTPPPGQFRPPEEPMDAVDVPARPSVKAVPPPPVEPMQPSEPFEAEALEPPPPFDEPPSRAAGAQKPAVDREAPPPPAPEPPFEIDREVHRAPPSEPAKPSRFEERREIPPPPLYEPSQPAARGPGRPVGPQAGTAYHEAQREEPPPPPPYYEEYYEEEPPRPQSKRRRNLLIGCGCLLLLLACAAVVGLGYLIWNAPYEFFQDPIGNFDRLFDSLTMLLVLP